MPWREIHLPESPWAPRGLPKALRSLPGWGVRAAVESRFGLEIADFGAAVASGGSRLIGDAPDGGGHPVLVIPGFGFGDVATVPVQLALHLANYELVMSRIAFNVDCSDLTVDHLVEVAENAVNHYGQRLHIVGHSRGGMLARGLAVRRPDLFDRVIAMGAPLNYEFAFYEIPAPLVRSLRVYHHRNPVLRELKCATPECTCPYLQAAHAPLPKDVDLVSLYSTSDGVVDWRSCVVPGATNIRVSGTHLGMGLKPRTLRIILRELAAGGNAGRDAARD